MKKIMFGCLLMILVLILTACACKHEETKLINAVEPTCTVEGYSGDTFCVKCEETISKGQSIAVLPHTEGELTDAMEPTCIEDGYTGDVYCIECGEKLTEGEVIPALGHTEGEMLYAADATCYSLGYTGDIFCSVCSETIHPGKVIDMLEHTPGDAQNAAEATCYSEGYTGDICCTVCGSLLTSGEVTPKLEHVLSEAYDIVEATCISEGYTGTRDCSVCGNSIRGDIIAKLDHVFDGNVCTVCEWMVPGLYVENELQMTWDQLIAGGYVQVSGSSLIKASENLMGTFVISEDIKRIEGWDGGFWHGTISPFYQMKDVECIYLPYGITSLGEHLTNKGTFQECASLKEIRAFGTLTDMGGERTFCGCSSLKEFEIPAGTVRIGEEAFSGCYSLEKITIPDSVTEIGKNAFSGTSALTSIELPEGLVTMGGNFYGTGISVITLPASVTQFEGIGTPYVDLSACNIESIPEYVFYNCKGLKAIKLPATLKTINGSAFSGCKNLEALVLPDGFESMRDASNAYSPFKYCESLKTVVWPVSFLDGKKLSPNYCKGLETIYYRGSELQWALTNSKDEFKNIKVVFNYEGDGSEFLNWP